MAETIHHYLIFETAGGFCGIAWSDAGITRFQLPTKSAEATERLLLRRLPDAEPGAPTPAVLETVAAVKRYFQGEETDFPASNSILPARMPSSGIFMRRQGVSAGAAPPLTARWPRSWASGRKPPATSARQWRRTLSL